MKDNGLKARIAKEVEANQKKIKKELEKQDVLRRKAKTLKWANTRLNRRACCQKSDHDPGCTRFWALANTSPS
ncbi:hypothetical protein Tco_0842989 [Tanacetum coccineum]|uniref:Remorin C-terminal domain-containing protein n=1 Tax=Tanacetum coccineum TaxID=301880 RepID=A0ABQ5B3K9_9ASTR